MTNKKTVVTDYQSIFMDSKKISDFRRIPLNQQGFVLLNLPRRIQRYLLHRLNYRELIEIVDYLDPDSAVDLLQNTQRNKRKKIIKKLNNVIKEKVEYLLKFNPKTAAGMMSLDYLEVDRDLTFKEIPPLLRKHERRTGRVPTILIVTEGFLLGELPNHLIGLAKKNEKINKYIKKIPQLKYNEDQNQVIETFKKHPHTKIAVLDEDNSILGIIYSDDIIDLIQRRNLDKLNSFAGINEEEDVLDPPLIKVRNRYKWLMLNLGTAFLAASVVALFENTIATFTLLAIYMPIVAGMGGNAGTQTLAVVIRGITLKEIELKTARQVIINEMLAGGLNGLINGLIVAIIALVWNHSPLLGLIVGIAMIINLIIAGLFGAIIPLIMKRLGKDPATSATIFITTATDVCGFFVFLGLASLIL